MDHFITLVESPDKQSTERCKTTKFLSCLWPTITEVAPSFDNILMLLFFCLRQNNVLFDVKRPWDNTSTSLWKNHNNMSDIFICIWHKDLPKIKIKGSKFFSEENCRWWHTPWICFGCQSLGIWPHCLYSKFDTSLNNFLSWVTDGHGIACNERGSGG